jgi:hypothetical protein
VERKAALPVSLRLIAELALAANWDRIVERKAVPLAFLKHKLA